MAGPHLGRATDRARGVSRGGIREREGTGVRDAQGLHRSGAGAALGARGGRHHLGRGGG
jgi:hypothetical protein